MFPQQCFPLGWMCPFPPPFRSDLHKTAMSSKNGDAFGSTVTHVLKEITLGFAVSQCVGGFD